MDENEASEGGGGFGDGVKAPMEKFHRNEAIPAVTDDGFLVEEEKDNDHEDLYNDVNVDKKFLQSFQKNKEKEKAVELVSPRRESGSAAVPAAVGEVKVEKGVDVFRDSAVRGNEMGDRDFVQAARSGTSAADRLKIVFSDRSSKMADLKKNASSNVVNREIIQRPTVASAGVLGNAGNVGNSGNDNMVRQGMVSGNATGSIGRFGALGGGPSGGGGGEGTILFVGDLHWWTTDAEVELELSKYGAVKEVILFNEIFNGKSKGYCHAEFYEPAAATACKEGMNGHVFNGRACVVAFASSPYMVRVMGETLVNRNKQNAQSQTAPVNEQARWGPGDSNNNNATVGYFQGGGDNNRGLGRGNRGRAGHQGMGNRGPVGPMRNRHGGVIGRGFMGDAGGGFGQGIGAASSLTHPQTMTGQGFDPAYGGPMGRMGTYGGFPVGPTPPSYSPVSGVGLPGATPYVNSAYFGRGMPMNNMGMMPSAGMEGPNMGMWSDPNMGGWAGDEHGYRAEESNYVAEPVSDHQYGEESRDRDAGPSNKEKDRGSERDRQEKRRQGYRDFGRERERVRDSNSARSRDRARFHRGRSSRTQAKSRLSHKDDSQSRSKDADSQKRRGRRTD